MSQAEFEQNQYQKTGSPSSSFEGQGLVWLAHKSK